MFNFLIYTFKIKLKIIKWMYVVKSMCYIFKACYMHDSTSTHLARILYKIVFPVIKNRANWEPLILFLGIIYDFSFVSRRLYNGSLPKNATAMFMMRSTWKACHSKKATEWAWKIASMTRLCKPQRQGQINYRILKAGSCVLFSSDQLSKDSYRYGRNTPHWSLKIWNH